MTKCDNSKIEKNLDHYVRLFSFFALFVTLGAVLFASANFSYEIGEIEYAMVFLSFMITHFSDFQLKALNSYSMKYSYQFPALYWRFLPANIVVFTVLSFLMGMDHWAGLLFFAVACLSLKVLILLHSSGKVRLRDYFRR